MKYFSPRTAAVPDGAPVTGTPSGRNVSDAGEADSVGIADEFDEFARSRQVQLRRAAYLLCGDWHLAEDLTQTALAKLYAVWRKVRMDSPDGYVRKVLYRTFVDETRRRRWWERPSAHQYDVAAPAQDSDLRLVLLDALRQVPARSRAVLVLRFWEDHSVEETAAALGCSTGTVKSQTSRGLATLRRILGDRASAVLPANGARSGAGAGTGRESGTGYLKAGW